MYLKGNFLRISYDALLKLDLSLEEIVLLSYIASFKGTCYATNKMFSYLLHVTERQVTNLLKDLKNKGYIVIDNENNKNRVIGLKLSTYALLKSKDKENN